ncbi:MAG: aminotransferase class III-fold pyridoxal phosphate-dependent enzyme [Acidimicrobiia bacterium]|nr:aminotransferase class III-fold pyridoxal phosphate-dependent enzyme [Acidimicrobiia bacterium]
MTDLISRHNDIYAPVIGWDSDREIVASDGTWVTDADGKRYLDFACGIAVSNLGHQHPGVKQAVLDQIDRLWHAGGAFRYDSLVDAAEKLVAVSPDAVEQVFFMNSGAEAVEASVKMARKVTGRQGIIVFRGGFHGRTMGSVSYTTSKAKYRQGYHPLVGSVFVTPFPHPFEWRMSQEDADALAIAELHRMLEHEITPAEVACMLVEPMQGEGGYYPGSPKFLQALRAICDEHGILLIADEVQTGFGRTGEWFASQTLGLRPDIVVYGKGIANGFPLSAVGSSKELFSQWPPGSHGTTYGGNPISCAASAATIEGLTEVIPGVAARSNHSFSRLAEMKKSHSVIGDVRGMGLMIGVELTDESLDADPAAIEHVKKVGLDEGLFILDCGPKGNVIRFLPPLNVSMDDLDRGLDIIDQALASYEA